MKEVYHSGDVYQIFNSEISDSWGKNVEIRSKDLENGTDYSYIRVIMPWVLERIEELAISESRILDVGCGCGYLTNNIYNRGFKKIDGIDISEHSIRYASQKYPQISFIHGDINTYKTTYDYDLCIAVMTVNNVYDAQRFFSALKKILKDNGKVILVLPHPCFWPKHHLKENEYNYMNETPYKFIFSTKGRKDYSSNVLFFHRTLETYLNYIRNENFTISRFDELVENTTQKEPDILAMVLC